MSALDRPENVNAYVEAHSAWMRFVYGQSWDNPEPLDPEEFMAEFARLISLDAPIPPFARKYLADLTKSQGPFRLILQPRGRAAQRFKTERRDYERALKIVDEIGKDENLSSVDAAIKEVLREEKIANGTAAKDIAITEGERRSWERSWNNAKQFMPELIERLDGLLDQRSKRSKP